MTTPQLPTCRRGRRFSLPRQFRIRAASAGARLRVAGFLMLLAALLPTALPQHVRAEDGAAPAKPNAQTQAEQERFFENRVRPVLVRHCLECHGEKKQQAGVRLDSRAALLADGDVGPAIVPGDPQNSRLIEVIQYAPDDVQMPPKGKLPDKDIAALTEWVRQGAPWPETSAGKPLEAGKIDGEYDFAAARRAHWAFQPIADPAPPDVEHTATAQDVAAPLSPVDRFLVARLTEAGMTLAPPAGRRTLIRRATFDLHGVPPTVEEVEAFLQDESPQAFERVVDRLLASPLYGQRWGRHWLDVARYADTRGYVFTSEIRYPYSYGYRDYVIRAFNEDLPYDRFLIEQIAADQLEDNDGGRALAAMGFLTVGQRFRNNQQDIIDDRIDVVTRGLMGLTVACARCHDHKYDPVPTADYYSLYGVFASSHEPNELPLVGEPDDTPEYRAYLEELAKRQAEVDEHVAENHRKLEAEFRQRTGDYLLQAVKQAAGDDGDTPSFQHGEPNSQVVTRWVNYLQETAKRHHPVFAPWHAMAALPKDDFAQRSAELIATYQPAESSEAERKDGEPPPRINRLVREALAEQPPGSMHDVARIYGRLLTGADRQWRELQESAQAGDDSAAADPPTALPDADAEELRQVLYADHTATTLTPAEAERLFDRVARDKKRQLENKVEQWSLTSPDAPTRAMVLYDADRPTEPQVFVRGNIGRRGERVPRRFPQILSPDEGLFTQGSGRLELARRIASPDNPLTARVLVNRMWMHHFGEGLVRTPGDFGTRSEPPTHPELLDYLASRFIEDGWSIKALHRRMMLSAVYQQSSDYNPDFARLDPDNRLLWRMPGRRLDFESMRDSMLAVAGRLDTAIGGRPVELTAQPFTTRRTVYGFINRNNLPNLFRTFDFANTEASTDQRPTTTVPQQALFALNSPFVIEQAKHLAAHPQVASAATDEEKIQALYRRTLARNAEPEEVELALNFLQSAPSTDDQTAGSNNERTAEQTAEPASNERETNRRRSGRRGRSSESPPAAPTQLTPWEQYAQALLVSNEFVFVD